MEKLICIQSTTDSFTVGKEYKIIDSFNYRNTRMSILISDSGNKMKVPLTGGVWKFSLSQ